METAKIERCTVAIHVDTVGGKFLDRAFRTFAMYPGRTAPEAMRFAVEDTDPFQRGAEIERLY